ncbi:MAG: tetratricopeptide repeat protein [Aquificaceae bacterium]|nr:tetratricopeptide repeat protein [Aquificaceae bacterium]
MTLRMCSFLLLLLLFSFPCFSQPSQAKESRRELLKLFLSTFLGVNDLKNALDVAKRGAQEYPEDPYWWEWYGKISEWLGQREEAMQAKLKLIELWPTPETIAEVYRQALSMQRYDYAVDLLSKYPQLLKEQKVEDLYFVYVNAGRVEEFVKVVQELYIKEKDPDYLYYLAQADFSYGEKERAESYLKELESLRPLKLHELLLYSDLLFAQRRMEENYHLLRRYLDKVETQREDLLITYYRRLSSISWLMRDLETAAVTAEALDRLGKAGAPEYVRIYFHYSALKDYQKAVRYARKGYEKTGDEYLFTLWVESLSSLRDWVGVVKAFELYERQKVLSNPYLLFLYSRALYASGRRKEGRELLLQALQGKDAQQALPNSIQIAVSYNDKELSDYILRKFAKEEKNLPRDFAVLYLARQEGQKAKQLMDLVKDKGAEDLLLYSHVLYVLGKTEEANLVRSALARNLSKEAKAPEEPQTLKLLLMSGIGILPAIKLQEALTAGKERLTPEEWLDIYLSYLFVNSFYERAEYAKHIQRLELKPWMELSLALRNNDRDRIAKLLEDMREVLPYRDVVESYSRLGFKREAMRHAQQSLEKNPEDALVYEQLRQLTHEHGNRLQVGLGYRALEKTDYLSYELSLRQALGERWYLLYSGEGGFLASSRNPAFRNLPSSYHRYSLSLRRLTNWGYYQVGLRVGTGVSDFVGLEAGISRKLFRLDNVSLFTYYNRPAVESLIAQLALLKDGFSLSLFESFTPRIGFTSSLEYSFFKSTHARHVGQGFAGYAELFHRLRYAYPDYTFRVFTSFGFYQEKSPISPELLKLFTFANPRLLPEDSLTLGLGFNFGLYRKELLSRPLLPFFDSELYYNLRAGFGYGLAGGFTGRVWDRDLLSVGFRRFSNFRTTGGSYWEPFTRYMLHF